MPNSPKPHTPNISPTFEVCIDEAGDDGMNCACGDWMILSAVISLRTHYGKDIGLVRDVKTALHWKQRKPLHFRDLTDEGKRIVIEGIAANSHRLRVISVFLHKPSLDPVESELPNKKNTLYFYLVRFLLERVSWACRDSSSVKNRAIGDGTARIIFSARTDLSYDELRQYFLRLQTMKTTIAWKVIQPDQFEVLKNGKHPGLQLADSVASGMYCCEHHCAAKKTREWAEKLKPVTYHHRGKYHSYGIKIFPPEAESKMAQGAIAQWAVEYFKN